MEKETVKEICASCHAEVENYLHTLQEEKDTTVEIVRKSFEHYRRPSVAGVVTVSTKEKAIEVCETISKIVECHNQKLSNLPVKKRLTYVVNMYPSGYGSPIITVSPAEQRRRMNLDELINFFTELTELKKELEIYKNKEELEKDLEKIKELSFKLNPTKKYTLGITTGNRFKVTYYDVIKEKRVQVSLGNIAVFYGGEVDPPIYANPRKTRTDKKDYIEVVLGCHIYE